jgi:hypothetical protein
MTATPFKGTLVAHTRRGNVPVNMRFSASDVANALVTWDDLNAIAQLTIPMASGGYVVDDLNLSAAGVDTTQIQVRKGTADTPSIVRDSLLANATTDAVSRCQGLRGRVLEPGATYFLKQLA